MRFENLGKKGMLVAAIAISVLVGAAGATVLKGSQVSAQTSPMAVSNPNPSGSINSAPKGTFKSNEDPAHEARESADWEAKENAGQAPWMNK